MDKLIICETDRGRYVVRPMSWAGIWNEKGQIKESLNHLALFIKKEDAEKFVEWKEAEEQEKLMKLPCAVGDTVYSFSFGKIFTLCVDSFVIYTDGIDARLSSKMKEYEFLKIDIDIADFGKKWFATQEEAEAALKELERGKGE